MHIKFWGTRGSIPTPLTSNAIENKIRQALTHHDPASAGEKIWAAQRQAEGYLAHRQAQHPCDVLIAYDLLSGNAARTLDGADLSSERLVEPLKVDFNWGNLGAPLNSSVIPQLETGCSFWFKLDN